MLHFVVNIGIMIYGSYLMRNFKKTLSFLLSTVIIVSSVVGVGTTVFAATDEHTYKTLNTEFLTITQPKSAVIRARMQL